MVEADPTAPAQERPGAPLTFRGDVSLGNILIIIGMLASAGVGIAEVSSRGQALQDAITHEADLRSADVAQLKTAIANLSVQQAADVQRLSASISDMRADVRLLVNSQHAWNGSVGTSP